MLIDFLILQAIKYLIKRPFFFVVFFFLFFLFSISSVTTRNTLIHRNIKRFGLWRHNFPDMCNQPHSHWKDCLLLRTIGKTSWAVCQRKVRLCHSRRAPCQKGTTLRKKPSGSRFNIKATFPYIRIPIIKTRRPTEISIEIAFVCLYHLLLMIILV